MEELSKKIMVEQLRDWRNRAGGRKHIESCRHRQSEGGKRERERMRDECWQSRPSIFLFCCHQLS